MRKSGYVAAAFAAIAICGYFAAANLVDAEERRAHWFWPERALTLGLDLQGGKFFRARLDHERGLRMDLERLVASLEQETGLEVRLAARAGRAFTLETKSREERAALVERLDPAEYRAKREGDRGLTIEPTPAFERRRRAERANDALTIVRRRLSDDSVRYAGVETALVGDDRIVVRIPGRASEISRSAIENLFLKTGVLEFKIVLDQAPTVEALLAKYGGELPEGSEISTQSVPSPHSN